MGKINTKNGEIYYSQIGNQRAEKTLIFIPGSGMTAKFMERFSMNFTEYNTITLDLPGHGQSTGCVSSSVQELADCIEGVIRVLYEQKIATEDITILGYSLGGFVAVSLGLIDMPQVKRIVVISSCADLATNPLGMALADMTAVDPMQIYSAMCGSKTEEEKCKEIQKMFLDDLKDAELLFKDLYSARAFNIIDKVSSIDKSMLIVIGDDDSVIQAKDAEHLAKLVKKSKIIKYSGFGHAMLFENTQQVVEDIKAFI